MMMFMSAFVPESELDSSGLSMFGGGIMMLIFIPILYGIFGFIAGLIGTALLNFILSKTNGLDIEFDNNNVEVSQIEKE